MNTLEHALGYAELGWHTFPLQPGSKEPATRHGKDDATAAPEMIRQLFGNGQGNANIAVSTAPSGLLVIDIDPRHGGDQTFRDRELELGALPPTVTADTGGGGTHYIFRAVAVDLMKNGLGPGIDVIRNGYIVAPPSIHPTTGKPYRWRDGHDPSEIGVAELPAAWIERATRKPAQRTTTDRPIIDVDARIKRARAYVSKMPEAIQGSNGSIALWNAVCAVMIGFDLGPQTTRTIIIDEYNHRCDPPWQDKELQHKIDDVAEKCDRPRGYLLEDDDARNRANRGDEPKTKTRSEAKKIEPDASEPDLFDENVPPPNDEDAPGAKRKRKGPVHLAGEYVAKFASHPDGVALRRWRHDWYRWTTDRGFYVPISDEALEASLYRDLKLDTRQDVGDVRHALIAVDGVLVDEAEIGTWIGEPMTATKPFDVTACPNGLLDLSSRKLTPATPRYFSTTALGVAYDRRARTPEPWLAFLEQLWPGDAESIAALQEWFGYLLTPDTRQQKILLVVGPKRSGKGTIMRVLTELLGRASVAAPTLASLGSNFGLWPLIGRTAAIIGDARLGGRSDIAQIVERLLSVSGQDPQTIDRKNRPHWTGYLSTRITIVSNELPRFTDASDALASRMVILELTKSWYGNEDVGLTEALIDELPGILSWAIEGWQRLRSRGHLVQPSSSADTVDDLADLAGPVRAWVRQRCDVGDGKQLLCEAAYADFKDWCKANGHDHVPTQTTFGRDLKAATGAHRKRANSGERERFYTGLRLKT